MAGDTNHQKKKPGAAYVALAAFIAMLICLVLQFSATGKLLGPNVRLMLIEAGTEGWKDGLPRDHLVAGVEMLIVVLLAFFYKRRFAWPFIALFFSALLGYSGYALITGEECGCFGTLWTPPKGLTVGLNGTFILGAFILMFMGRVKPLVMGITLALCLGAGGFGYYQAGIDRPGTDETINITVGEGGSLVGVLTGGKKPAEDSTGTTPTSEAPQRVRSIPALEEAMNDAPGDRLTYVFFYDKNCNVCEEFKPIVEMQSEDFEQSGVPVKVLFYEINELEKNNGIPIYAWARTPTVIALDGGELVYYEIDEQVAFPADLYEKWSIGEDLGGSEPSESFFK